MKANQKKTNQIKVEGNVENSNLNHTKQQIQLTCLKSKKKSCFCFLF